MADEVVIREDRGDGRDKNGRMLPGHVIPGARRINSVQAREMALRKHQLARENAAEGLLTALQEKMKGGDIPLPKVPVEAYKHLIRHAVDVYLKTDSARGLSELGNFISKAAGMVVDPAELRAEQAPDNGTLTDANIILQVFNYYDEHPDEHADAIDAEAK